jgi:Immunoglobulin I-set domain
LPFPAPPKFKKKMADMACMTDAPFKMQVEVEGSPAPELKWYKDGQMIIESERIKVVKESENSFSLIIERVLIEDSGSYSVVAANSLGQMSEFWQLVANSLPSFTQSLIKSAEKTEGESVTFQVKADGSPKPTASWRKDGMELKSDGKNIIIKEEAGLHTLTVNGLKREDAGNYSCLLSNAFGSKEDVAVLRVRAPPLVKQGLTDTEVKEGQTDVTFTVTVDSYPEPKITW